jgi:hypothetical protein
MLFMPVRVVFIFLTLFFFQEQVYCQRPAAGNWLTVQLPVQLNTHWQIHTDFNFRTLGNSANALQRLHRVGLRYIFNKHWSTTIGGALASTRTTYSKENDVFAREFRFWEELNYKIAVGNGLTFQTRIRTEERSFAATASKEAYQAFRYRIKPQLQQQITPKWAVLVADEYMEQHAHNKWSFDQNRFIVNGIYLLNKQTQLQAGYMWLQWPQHSAQNIIMLSLQKNISLHAK